MDEKLSRHLKIVKHLLFESPWDISDVHISVFPKCF